MQLARMGFIKRNISIPSFIRNTSCSRGWLRVVIQVIFSTLIVASFILIVLMALESSYRSSRPAPRCTIINCRVICNEAPFYGQYEEDIISTASEVDPNCESIALQLNRPTFENSKIPEHWLSRIRSNVRELAIIGGNTQYISSYAFMSPLSSTLKTLILEKIEINYWDTNMLIGLSRLKQLFIKDCFLKTIRKNALRIVDDSLQFLDIKATNVFNPINITGSSKLMSLTVVDFSLNNFHNILGSASFSKLKYCRILFLNSCNIKTLEPGTFDNLENIEMLYLNDNNLITVPVGLFDKMLLLQPKIALQGNDWHCDCSINDLRNVFVKGLLIIDPFCHYPDTARGMTFSDFEGYCNRVHNIDSEIPDSAEKEHRYSCQNKTKTIFINGPCLESNSSNCTESRLRSMENQKCYLNRINNKDLKFTIFEKESEETSSSWIKPVFSIQKSPYSMIEMTSSAQPGLGLLWYQSLCSNEVFCSNTIPDVLKIFNVNCGTRYTFCPFSLTNETVLTHQCVSYNFVDKIAQSSKYPGWIMYIFISLGCLLAGAIFVYALIQRNPTLLKGNKRVIFVKHKSVEALILPPPLPIRKQYLNDQLTTNDTKQMRNHIIERQKIFLLPDSSKLSANNNFIRSVSTRSNNSNDGSYISALQPTEEQLSEWRSNQMIKTLDSKSSSTDISPFSSIYGQDSLPYYSIHTSERIYEVPK